MTDLQSQIADFAPVALFAYRRADHLRRALTSLAENSEFQKSDLYIFCDGAKSSLDKDAVIATRQVARDFPHPRKSIIEQTRNRGLAESIVAGVTEICSKHGRVIVVEDDLVVAPTFLAFMNRALKVYVDDDQVMQISGFFPPIAGGSRDAVFLPVTTTWGWATWSRAWRKFDPRRSGRAFLERYPAERRRFDLDGSYPYFRMLCQQDVGKVDSWGIAWYLSVYLNGGLVLYPRQSLVLHELDGTGTHCRLPQQNTVELCGDRLEDFPEVAVDEIVLSHLKSYNRNQSSFVHRYFALLNFLWNRVVRSGAGYSKH
jgi:hypothetical protein